jgi:two-component system, LytTR family, response regulator
MDFRIAIVDDEPIARDAIRYILRKNCPDVSIAGEAGGVGEALRLLSRKRPDLLLLSVELADGTGFDLLDRVSRLDFKVVFTAACDAFAFRAFRYNAIDYLLKPVDPDELVAAVCKARPNINHVNPVDQIAGLSGAALEKSSGRIILNTRSGMVLTQAKDVARLESCGNYTFVFLAAGERCLVSRNLKEFEGMLQPPVFFRTHQSHIVNTAFVKKFLREEGYYAVMYDGAEVPVARRRKEAFLGVLKGRVFEGR